MATFKTRARTLDMLGRQQIAGLPTAISELFKNAHDAYADRVEIDFYRSDGLFVLRDDGVGMSKDDFSKRWLTIGTESKLYSEDGPARPPQKAPRPMLGEKGIGRLSIATIGPQLLVLTRTITDEGYSDLTAAFVNWSIFEWPRIDLEQIEIPLRTFSGGALPTARDVTDMVMEFRMNAESVGRSIHKKHLQRLAKELDQFVVDPQDIDSYLRAPSLSSNGCGTHFIIKPTSPLLAEDIDGDPMARRTATLNKATPLKKALLGFSNTMVPHSSSVMRTAFRDHRTDEIADELLAEDEFFTPEEFQDADHRIRGDFDEFGQFRGEVKIYAESTADHLIPWAGSLGVHTKCGPFSIDFAAFEGEKKHSTIPNEKHAKLAHKTDKLGGLYIYRNGIRVLPYGDTDFDWLDIEYRRSKSAGYYYFSHRKMFGAVEIDADTNRNLHEKAGREGFQENKAYRQFKSILQNFFLQIAADFFRQDGAYAESFDLRKKELSSEQKALKRRQNLVNQRRKVFKKDLDVFFNKVDVNAPQKEALQLTELVDKKLQSTLGIADKLLAAQTLLELEHTAKTRIRELENLYRIPRPKIALSKNALRDWTIYTSEFTKLQENVFQPARNCVEELIGEQAQDARLSLNRQVRTKSALESLAKETEKTIRNSVKSVKNEANRVAVQARAATELALRTFDLELRAVFNDFQRTDLTSMPDVLFVETRNELENRIQNVADEQETVLRSILEQLQSFVETDGASVHEQLVATEQRNILLEEEAEVDSQLVHLGMAIEIINHEFSATIRAVRNGLRKLKAWADINEGLRELYNSIRTSFDHLDGYLTLFTPLQRRLYRKAVKICGADIHDFLEELFRARFERHGVTFTATKTFKQASNFGFPSDFYPVFVNLIDNAIYWLSLQNPERQRRIKLDDKMGIWLIQDTGPGVSVRDRDAIFEFGFSRKPGGRGMGLHIGRETLRRIGFNLELIDGENGATFGILPLDEQKRDGKD